MHPALRIIGLVLLAIVMQFAAMVPLLLAGGIAVGVAMSCCRQLFLRMLRRSKWLLVTVLAIFSFSTPGQYVHDWPWEFAPTYEGLEYGAMQLVRLVVMLAGLSVLLRTTRQDALMAGIYTLLRPLGGCGLPVERFTARLWLTLDYVERTPEHAASRWMMQEVTDHVEFEAGQSPIRLEVPVWTVHDSVLVCAMFSLLLWCLR